MDDQRFGSSTSSFRAVRPCVVGIASKTGARYEFPEMDRAEIFKILGGQLYTMRELTLTNLSGAVLKISVQDIDSIAIDGEVSWRTSSSTP